MYTSIQSSRQRRSSLFVRIVILPLSIVAVIFLCVGIYSFMGANLIMRIPPETHEGFPSNILPSFSNASFTSLDGLTKLEGWFFRTAKEPVSTVVMVHGFGRDRLQFGTDTVHIYDYFLSKGFNVLSFDLRHSGSSGGNINTFGYSEWQDVLGAISYAKRTASTTDVILYGLGSGSGAALAAYEKLPGPDSDPEDFPYNIQVLGFDQSYIRSFIFDGLLVSADDYIGMVCAENIVFGDKLGRAAVPYAVRLSSGIEKRINLAAAIARINVPVHLIYGDYSDRVMSERAQTTVSERVRMFPDKTTVYVITDNGSKISPYSDILYDPSGYTGSISEFLGTFLPS